MQLTRRLPLSALIDLCRTMRHYLSSGLSLLDVFRQQANKGSPPLRPVAQRVALQLEKGNELVVALEPEHDRFPPLFLAMTSVGEETGHLPEVARELEKYFLLQQRLRRMFLSQIAWPVFQLVVGVFVIAGMIFILGLLAQPGQRPFDPLGFGLTGERGALLFLLIVFGGFGGLVLLYWVVTRFLGQQAAVERILLRIPVLGPCLRTLALARFSLALRLTLETGLSVPKSLGLCLKATGSAAFQAATDQVKASAREGEDLATTLTQTHLFPEEFLHVVAVAEESGRLTEVMEQQSQYYQEESERRLTALTQAAGWGIWALVAALIIFMVFRIALTYIGMLDPDNPMYRM